MKKECTEQDLRELARSAQAVFEAVTLTEAPLCDGWQDDGLRVDYELRNGRVDCVLHRRVEADGKCWELEMSAPLAGNVLPEERMTPRERELCREDMSHDFLTGVYNRRYLETVFAQKLEQCAAQGRKAAVALVSIDNGQKLRDTYGQPVMDQLHCFVGNQWKKNFDTPATRVVCRLTGSIFAVGCLDADGKQLAEEMQNLYRQMPGMHHHHRHDAPGTLYPELRRSRAGECLCKRTGRRCTSCAMHACGRHRTPAAIRCVQNKTSV